MPAEAEEYYQERDLAAGATRPYKRVVRGTIYLLIALLLRVTVLPLWLQSAEGDPASTQEYSREMRRAIRSFNTGNDSEAMDQFMDILVHGRSTERAAANSYLNLLTQRMNIPSGKEADNTKIIEGESSPVQLGRHRKAVAKPAAQPPRPSPLPSGERENVGISGTSQPLPSSPTKAETAPQEQPLGKPFPGGDTRQVPQPSARAEQNRANQHEAEAMPADKRAQMRREIEARIHGKVKFYLGELAKKEAIRIILSESNNPRAIGLPTSLLFGGGISFTRDAGAILRNLAGLVYSLGSAQMTILPEGAAAGDSKVLDMRRGMGISSYLYSSGIAPPRVRVNLVQAQADVPRALSDFHGIVILFVYNQSVPLTAEHVVGEEEGPPASLGVFPDSFRADRGEGAVIEFSITEPPSGLKAWKYQLLQPETHGGGDLVPLQEVTGATAQFHQIFWNGRKGYFGEVLPPGRYEAVLSATDGNNRTRILRRWIVLEGTSALSSVRLLDSSSVSNGSGRKNLNSPPKPNKIKNVRVKPAPPAATESAPVPRKQYSGQPAESKRAESSPRSEGAVTYKIAFEANTQNITPEGERQLSYVADAMTFYPQENLDLIGYAGSDEADASALAQNRAKQVASALAGKYGIDARRIRTQSKVSGSAKPEVAIYSYVNQ